jgi:solute carrier family 13 (sodium-dependent dicarboxylate transporter), member 2/3/5
VNFDFELAPSFLLLLIVLLMAYLWISNRVHLAVTALLPLVLFPLTGIMSAAEVSKSYSNSVIALFFGGFVLSIAVQKTGLHQWFAYKVLGFTGLEPRKLLLGFIISTAFLSMWLSNTAAAILMITIASSVIDELKQHWFYKDAKEKFIEGLLISIAYSASIGGMATLIGTPPNMILKQVLQNTENIDLSFSQWMIMTLPLVIILLTILFFLFSYKYCPKEEGIINAPQSINLSKSTTNLNTEQKTVLSIFLIVVFAWLTRTDLDIGLFIFPGWSSWLDSNHYFDDSTIIIAACFFLFIIPSQENKARKILHWDDLKDFPWEIILLFGGGFALADAIQRIGLSQEIFSLFDKLESPNIFLCLVLIIIFMKLMSELTSNTATAQIILPILAGLSTSLGFSPLILLYAAALSASCPFMLPVATPPNALVIATNNVKVSDMWKIGLFFNMLTIIIIFAYISLGLIKVL